MRNLKRGFTLIEVLIVVVIIAVLAALILPRLTGQTKKAQAAEAFQVLGAIRRAAERLYTTTGSYNLPSGQILGGVIPSHWQELGLVDLEKSHTWMYYYTFGNSGQGFKTGALAAGGASAEYTFNLDGLGNYDWICDGTYLKYKDPLDHKKGCTI